jgi:hypothetical protein
MSVIKNISELRASGYDPSSIEDAMRWNERWEAFLASPIATFLAYGDPQELWKHPDAPVLDIDSIARNVQELAPDAILFKFGLLPVWTSIGGNSIAYHPESAAFYWADHECIFGDECVLVPKTYEELPLNFENLMKAIIRLSTEQCGTFLRNLRDGLYDAELRKLD